MTIAAVVLIASACAPIPPDQYQSLRAGQRQASLCVERLHDGLRDFIECIRYVAVNPPRSEARPDWWAMGALHYGWLLQDITDANAGEDAADAQALLAEAERLRLRLEAPDAALCTLVEMPCKLQKIRRQERLAGR